MGTVIPPGDTQSHSLLAKMLLSYSWQLMAVATNLGKFYGLNAVKTPGESEFGAMPISLQPKTLRLSQVGEQMRQFEADWGDSSCPLEAAQHPPSAPPPLPPPHPSPCGPATLRLILQDPTLQRFDNIFSLYWYFNYYYQD